MQRNKEKEAGEETKKEAREQFVKKIEKQHNKDRKKFWTTVKGLKGRKTPKIRNVKDKGNNIITDKEGIVEVRRKYYKIIFEIIEEGEQQDIIQDQAEVAEKVEQVIKNTLSGKETGKDRLPNAVISYLHYAEKLFERHASALY
ncbi:hypothetical protein FQA39_LY10849 [Lamprigera yunnana]|nr:hypothetical protein FQA39_LY10849 [Lamprigera yunnana]